MTECPANATARCPGFNRGEVVDGYQCARGYNGDTCQKCAAPRTYEAVGQPTEAYYKTLTLTLTSTLALALTLTLTPTPTLYP